MRPPLILVFLLPLSLQARAQLHITTGATMTIAGGTALVSDSLLLQPASSLALSNFSVTPSYTAVGGLSGNSVQRVYTFSQPLITDGTIGFYYADAELNGNTASMLQIAYYNGATWTTTNAGTSNTATRLVSNAFSSPVTLAKITAVNGATPLPLQLLSFDARAENEKARLDWEVAQPGDAARYEVERSTDGRSFSRAGAVNATAMSGYIFYDNNPAEGVNYYRIRVYGKDGNAALSAVKPVLFSRSGAQQLIVYPLPVKDVLHLELAAEPGANAAINISDLTGKLLLTRRCTARSQAVDVAALAAGMYLLRYEDGGTVISLKLERL